MDKRISLPQLLSLCLCSLAFISCASEQTVTRSKVDRDEWGKPVTYKVGEDDAGNPQMQSDVRSSFESVGGNKITSGNHYSGKEYTKKSYRKERWGGDSVYRTKSYNDVGRASNYDKEPWFIRKQAITSGQEPSEGKKSFFSKIFGKSTAREQDATRLTKTSDTESAVRRRVFKQPDVISWKGQSALSVQDTKGMLSR